MQAEISNCMHRPEHPYPMTIIRTLFLMSYLVGLPTASHAEAGLRPLAVACATPLR